jgi:hypothetical protein
MSLINDALKRAKQSQKKNPAGGGQPLIPVESNSPSAVAWILPVVIIILVVAACFVLGLAMARHTVTAIVNAPEPDVTKQEVVVTDDLPSNLPPPLPVVMETNLEVVAAPNLPKLQGIAYDPVKPWAILSGQTVYVGDPIGEFRVKAISKFTVTVAGKDGKLKIISLGN